ncbi:MAG TPA: hypothetical protein VHU19_07390 [Pyrinomonadaceae bacterium]|jgi:hypothetical protein|nr:hypothetical protein [Pyrinomonadaceae bacterium]
MTDKRTTNRALVRHVLLPTIFLTVALTGGVRVVAETGALVFVPPPLVTLILALMLLSLFLRGGAVVVGAWLSAELSALSNVSHALTLAALFFASAQSFNSVLPDAGLLRWMLSFFFLWTLWQNQFSTFDARRLLRSLAALFGTAFVIKHLLLASLYAPGGGGWLRQLAGALFEGFTSATLGGPAYAPATGYVSFFTLALYVCGLLLMPPAPQDAPRAPTRADDLVETFRQLPTEERERVSAAILNEGQALEATPLRIESVATTDE